jgi:hypothetical protein
MEFNANDFMKLLDSSLSALVDGERTVMLAVYIAAKNSPNGNPQRGWLIADDDGNFIDFVDEGYTGNASLRMAGYEGIAQTPRIEVSRSTYHEAYRDAERKHKSERKPQR